jgi:streptogramin lyase
MIPGGALRIAVDPDGNPWVVNDAGTIYRRNGSRWEEIAPLPASRRRAKGGAIDVGIGADGTAWALARGGSPYRWTGSTWTAIDGPVESVALAVGPKGEAWVVDRAGDIQRFEPDTQAWTRLPAQAQDVAVAADGTAFIVGAGPGTVSRLEAGTWVADPSAAGSRISAGPAGTLVVLKAGAPLVTGMLLPKAQPEPSPP